MNSYFVILIVVALYVAYALFLLLIRAFIVRTDIYRQWAQHATHYARSATIQDLRPVQEAAINMPLSAATRELLQRLAENRAASAR